MASTIPSALPMSRAALVSSIRVSMAWIVMSGLIAVSFSSADTVFFLPDIAVEVEDLAVQVRLVDNIHVNDGDRPDPRNGKVEGDR